MLKQGITLVVLVLLTACTSFGPGEIAINRKIYNDVVRDTENEQLLKNIIRLRYSEATFFLKLTSVTTSFSLSDSVALSPSVSYSTNGPGSSWSVSKSFSPNAGLSYSDSPTFSYAPVESTEFATQIQTPLTLAQVLIPYGSGNYSEIRDLLFIARLVVDSIGDLSNAGTLTSSKIIEMPDYKDYYDVLRLIHELRVNGSLIIRERLVKGYYTIHLHFYSKADATSKDALKLKKALNVPPNSDGIYLSDTFPICEEKEADDMFLASSKPFYQSECPKTKAVHLELRSILGIMRFLSFSVQVPKSDIESGQVHELRYPDGRLFDTETLFKGLMTIHSSEWEPKDAYIKVFAYNHWFYIKKTDYDSKTTFTSLQRLMTLIAGSQAGMQNSAPVLTIPVK